VKIGRLWWMAENLNYEVEDSCCYNDSAEYCAKYGRLYMWSAAMDSLGQWSETSKGCGNGLMCDITPPVRGICPEGWYLPSSTEWYSLFEAIGGKNTAGKYLKSTSGWIDGGNGLDAYGFSALPAGTKYGRFQTEGEFAFSVRDNRKKRRALDSAFEFFGSYRPVASRMTFRVIPAVLPC